MPCVVVNKENDKEILCSSPSVTDFFCSAFQTNTRIILIVSKKTGVIQHHPPIHQITWQLQINHSKFPKTNWNPPFSRHRGPVDMICLDQAAQPLSRTACQQALFQIPGVLANMGRAHTVCIRMVCLQKALLRHIKDLIWFQLPVSLWRCLKLFTVHQLTLLLQKKLLLIATD